MGVINRTARGLLSLLDSNTQGFVPNTLGEEISPTLDLSDYLMAARGWTLSASTITPITIPGVITAFVVPAGEMWMLYMASVEVLSLDAAAGVVRVYPCIALPGQPAFPIASTFAQTATAAIGAGPTVTSLLPRLLPLNQGTQIQFVSNQLVHAGAGYSMGCSAMYMRLNV